MKKNAFIGSALAFLMSFSTLYGINSGATKSNNDASKYDYTYTSENGCHSWCICINLGIVSFS